MCKLIGATPETCAAAVLFFQTTASAKDLKVLMTCYREEKSARACIEKYTHICSTSSGKQCRENLLQSIQSVASVKVAPHMKQ